MHRRRLCTVGIPFLCLFGLGNSLGLVEASENNIEDDNGVDIVVFGVPFAMTPAGLPPSARLSADGSERSCWSLLGSAPGVPR